MIISSVGKDLSILEIFFKSLASKPTETGIIKKFFLFFKSIIDFLTLLLKLPSLINKILELAKQILLDIDNNELFVKNSREICDLWKEILPYMWW